MEKQDLPVRHVSKFTDEQAETHNAAIAVVERLGKTVLIGGGDERMWYQRVWVDGALETSLYVIDTYGVSREVAIEIVRGGVTVFNTTHRTEARGSELVSSVVVRGDPAGEWKDRLMRYFGIVSREQEAGQR